MVHPQGQNWRKPSAHSWPTDPAPRYPSTSTTGGVSASRSTNLGIKTRWNTHGSKPLKYSVATSIWQHLSASSCRLLCKKTTEEIMRQHDSPATEQMSMIHGEQHDTCEQMDSETPSYKKSASLHNDPAEAQAMYDLLIPSPDRPRKESNFPGDLFFRRNEFRSSGHALPQAVAGQKGCGTTNFFRHGPRGHNSTSAHGNLDATPSPARLSSGSMSLAYRASTLTYSGLNQISLNTGR